MSKLHKFKTIVFYAQNTCYLFLLKRCKYKKSSFLRIGKKKNAFGKIKYLGRPYCIFSFVAILHFPRKIYFFLTIWEWFERMQSIGFLTQILYTQYLKLYNLQYFTNQRNYRKILNKSKWHNMYSFHGQHCIVAYQCPWKIFESHLCIQ